MTDHEEDNAELAGTGLKWVTEMTDRETLDYIAEQYTADTNQTELLPSEKLVELWEEHEAAAKPSGYRDNMELYCIDSMIDAAWDLREYALSLEQARTASPLSAAAALQMAAGFDKHHNIKQLDVPLCCSGFDNYGQVDCGCQGATVREDIVGSILALIPDSDKAALDKYTKAVEAAVLEKAADGICEMYTGSMAADIESDLRHLIDPDAQTALAERVRAAKVRALKRASHIFVWANDKKSAVEKIEALIKATEENEWWTGNR